MVLEAPASDRYGAGETSARERITHFEAVAAEHRAEQQVQAVRVDKEIVLESRVSAEAARERVRQNAEKDLEDPYAIPNEDAREEEPEVDVEDDDPGELGETQAALQRLSLIHI